MRSAHEPEQSVYGAGQVNEQEPDEHTSPEAQAAPHSPQFMGSFERFLQMPEHEV
jgi:hypothetical protein